MIPHFEYLIEYYLIWKFSFNISIVDEITADELLLLKVLSNNSIPCRIEKYDIFTSYFSPPEHQLFLLDASCNNSKYFLEKGSQLNLFRHPFKWIIWGQSNENDLKQMYFRIDSKIFVIYKEKRCNDEIYHIQLLYKLEGALEFIKNDLAVWNSSQGFLTFNEFSFYRNRSNLMGLKLNIGFVVTDPRTYQHLEDYRDVYIDTLTKYNWFGMKLLTPIFNVTPNNIFHTTWGYPQKDKTFNGMIGDLQFNRAELGGSSSFITKERIEAVDFVAPSAPTYIKFIFRAPPLTSVSNVFTLPFSSSVWYACFAIIPIILIVVFVIVKWEWEDDKFKEKVLIHEANSISPLQPRFFDVLVMELGAITQQGAESEPKSNAGRIATICVFIAFMFLFTSYAANIVAILQSTTDNIKTVEDLLNSRMSCGVEDLPYQRNFFETAKEPIRKAIYEQKIAPKGQKSNFISMHEGISRVQKGFFAFHVEIFTGYTVISKTFQEDEKCSLKELVYTKHTEPWISIKKKSAYFYLFKVGLIRAIEMGIQRRHYHRLYTKKPVCNSNANNFVSVGILDIYAAFLIFGIGTTISVTIFIFEIFMDKKIKQTQTFYGN